MKNLNLATFTATVFLATFSAFVNAAVVYELTFTNGGPMPISPAAVYVKNGQSGNAEVGQFPTMGFVQLCQTGSPMRRVPELNMDREVTYVTQTMAPLMPGETQVIEVQVQDPLQQSIHLEAMYGKTKDVCAVATVGSHALYALQQHVTSEYQGKDSALASGAFTNPTLPMGTTYPNPTVCNAEKDAVSCLRTLSQMANGKIHFLAPYFPSLLNFLEMKYGAADAQTLILPTAGALQLKLKLKH